MLQEAEPDLLGAAAREVYLPDPRHVRHRLADLLKQLKAAKSWPWKPAVVKRHRDRNVPYLCALLPGPEGGRALAREV
ncbi:MAG: hypothetical protein ACRED5_17440 [Propylenella sp.]